MKGSRLTRILLLSVLSGIACNDAPNGSAPQGAYVPPPGTSAPGSSGTNGERGATPGQGAPSGRLSNEKRWKARRSRPPQTLGAAKTFAGINPETATLSPLAPAAQASTPNPGGSPDFYGTANYANSPFLQVAGSGAAARAVVDNDPASATFGHVTALELVSGGSGYTVPPTVAFSGGFGTGAGFLAHVDATVGSPTYGQVTGFTRVSGGAGYVSSPAVWITGAPIAGTGVRKFVDALPGFCGVTPGATNDLGQCLPVAQPLAAAVAAAKGVPTDGDYYEIALVEYSRKLHADLPPTRLRGYVDRNPASTQVPQHLGPVIVATRNRPVRLKFTNELPTGDAGRLFIPTDRSYSGAGAAPDGTPYAENRAVLHLHGGNTPWISDGTPHQWTIPAGEVPFTNYPKGESSRDVPDMPATKVGEMTFYWTNQQSGRLLFYHDHAFAVTRLNVYAGEAAGYLLVDPDEEDALAVATVPGTITSPTATNPSPPAADWGHVLPLVIEEKTFTPDDGEAGGQLASTDPTYDVARYGGRGQLWFPHVYTPNQNPADLLGANAFGRWDYGPWFWPPQDPKTLLPNGRPYACDSVAYPPSAPPAFPPLLCPGIPHPSGTPEAFMDTPIVNGTAYPVMTVEPSAYRFQMLAAGNDRSWNFGLYYAATREGVVCRDHAVSDLSRCTEVSMVPSIPHNLCSASISTNCLCNSPYNPPGCLPQGTAAVPLCDVPSAMSGGGLVTAQLDADGNPNGGTGLPGPCWPTSWPTDGRDGGVPDPLTAGPPFIQIGTEGGLLPAPVVIPSTPIGYEYRGSINVLGHGLLLGPAERADVVVDFSRVPTGSALILYNDGPAPNPGADSRVDYFTGDADQSPIGGAPSTPPGYGPNTRTVMQIRVEGQSSARTPFRLPALSAALPALFAATQDGVIVPQTAYPAANGGAASSTYSRIQDSTLAYFEQGGAVGNLVLTAGGAGYSSPPQVQIAPPACAPGPACVQATATATIGASVTSVGLASGGAGYTRQPTVTVAPPACAPSAVCAAAAAEAVLAPTSVANLQVTRSGSGYTSLPTIVVDPPGCVGCTTALAQPVMSADGRRLVSITLVDPGSGYSSDPAVAIFDGGGAGAAAVASLVPTSIAGFNVIEGGAGYTGAAPGVTIGAVRGATPATATAALGPSSVLAVNLVDGGAGYASTAGAPAVTISGGGGAGALAYASGQVRPMLPKTIQELFTLDYGRMNATLGVEVPFTNFNTRTSIPYAYADPPTELVREGETQIWKIAHNGVDTHFIHFHLFTVQIVNRVGWDGRIKPPDPNELSWKDTVRMNPQEDVIVALRPFAQTLPFELPISVHALDVTKPLGKELPYVFAGLDPTRNAVTVTNDLTNFGFEYVWHCHILGHEENDMMRPISVVAAPAAPTGVSSTILGPRAVDVTWAPRPVPRETSYTLQRAPSPSGPWNELVRLSANATHYADRTVRPGRTYSYRVIASNVVGYTRRYAPPASGWPSVSADSPPSEPTPAVTLP